MNSTIKPPTISKATFISFATHAFPAAMFVILIYAFYNIKQTTNILNPYTIALFVLFGITAIAAPLYYSTRFVPAFSNFAIFATGLIGLFGLAAIIYNNIVYYLATVKNTAYFALIFFGVLLGGAIILMMLTSMFTNETIQAFFRTLLAAPGLLVQLAEQFNEEFPNAPPAFAILFILEVILILFICLIPFLISQNPPFYSSIQFNGVYLLQTEPLNLTDKREIVLTNSHQLSIVDDPNTTDASGISVNPYQKTFTLSAWIYMNPSEAAQNTKETTILYYGQKELEWGKDHWKITNPKPKITYIYDPTLKRDMYNIYLQEAHPNTPTYRAHIPNQKWNNFVFVFEADRANLYINGHLEKSFPQSIGITKTFTANDQIAIGDQENVSYGAVANIIYYDYPMTQNQVVDSWNKQQYWVDGTVYIPGSRPNSNQG